MWQTASLSCPAHHNGLCPQMLGQNRPLPFCRVFYYSNKKSKLCWEHRHRLIYHESKNTMILEIPQSSFVLKCGMPRVWEGMGSTSHLGHPQQAQSLNKKFPGVSTEKSGSVLLSEASKLAPFHFSKCLYFPYESCFHFLFWGKTKQNNRAKHLLPAQGWFVAPFSGTQGLIFLLGFSGSSLAPSFSPFPPLAAC